MSISISLGFSQCGLHSGTQVDKAVAPGDFVEGKNINMMLLELLLKIVIFHYKVSHLVKLVISQMGVNLFLI